MQKNDIRFLAFVAIDVPHFSDVIDNRQVARSPALNIHLLCQKRTLLVVSPADMKDVVF